jgi:hypothetical protein
MKILGNIAVQNLVFDPPRFATINFPLSRTRAGAVNNPVWALLRDNGAGSVGVWSWQFAHLAEQELFFAFDVPNGAMANCMLIPMFNWCPMSAGVGNIAFGIEYTFFNEGEVIPATTIDVKIAASPAVALQTGETTMTEIGPLPWDSRLIVRIFRNGTNVLDTYADPVSINTMHFHFPRTTIGAFSEHIQFKDL